jgi:hypothetical protein
MNRSVKFPLAVLAAALLATIPAPAFADAGALDGKTFEGVFLERGKTRGDADTLIFKDGRFRSTACDRYGYGEASYKTSSEGDLVRFEVETTSAKYGPLKWKGWVQGDKLDATAMMMQDGKAPIENWVVAGLKR